MRAVVQRCSKGSVRVDGRSLSEIGKGYVVLVGVGVGDTEADAIFLADKVAHLRVMSDEQGKMNRSILDTKAEVLAVSQFTLYGDTREGRRPSFIGAARPEEGRVLFDRFVGRLQEHQITVKTGEFGADMLVTIENDGPVTILIDSTKLF